MDDLNENEGRCNFFGWNAFLYNNHAYVKMYERVNGVCIYIDDVIKGYKNHVIDHSATIVSNGQMH